MPQLVQTGVKARGMSIAQKDRLRARAWRFRESRSCHRGGNDRVSSIIDFCEGMIAAGVDRREVITGMVCAVRRCGDCK